MQNYTARSNKSRDTKLSDWRQKLAEKVWRPNIKDYGQERVHVSQLTYHVCTHSVISLSLDTLKSNVQPMAVKWLMIKQAFQLSRLL